MKEESGQDLGEKQESEEKTNESEQGKVFDLQEGGGSENLHKKEGENNNAYSLEESEQKKKDEAKLEDVRCMLERMGAGAENNCEAKKDGDKQKEQDEKVRMSPSDVVAEYSDEGFRKKQKEERPVLERAINKILENDFGVRKERAQELASIINSWLETIRKNGAKNIVDLGCGQGEMLKEFLEILRKGDKDFQGIGIDNKTDISPKMLDDNFVFVKGDALDTSLAKGSVDVVTINFLFQVLDEEQQRDLIEEVKRIISENGSIIIMDEIDRGGAKGKWDKALNKMYNLNPFAKYNIRTEERWKDFWESNGFDIEDTKVDGRIIAYLVKVKKEVAIENVAVAA